MKKGNIGVQTENIFPIIKKFLYSDHDIFLRELISNAVDACQKVKLLSNSSDFEGEIGELKISISIDKKAKTLTISDTGIGMTEEEVEKYINQLAFSGAKDFVSKYEKIDAKGQIIGNFGLGFYSSFMVSEKVQILTKSSKKKMDAVQWECDGSPAYSIDKVEKKERGTDIILHLNDDSKEFLEETKISEILFRYCKFLPIPIFFGEEESELEEKGKKIKRPKQINNTAPLWKKTLSNISDEEYKKFYKELYPMVFTEPVFSIHLNIDHPFNLTGILYFPKLESNMLGKPEKIHLYCNQVFVTDNVERIVPEFLTHLQGIIDSPDIPLNVSRSYLQTDSRVKKISKYIQRKVADKLAEMYRNDTEKYQEIWEDLKVFVEMGMITEDNFFEASSKFYILQNVKKEFSLLNEYLGKIKENQTDKDKNIVVLYTDDTEKHSILIENAKEKGFDVAVLNTVLTAHLVNKLEQKNTNLKFKRIDSDSLSKLIDKDEKPISKLSDKEKGEVKTLFENFVDKTKFSIGIEDLNETDMPFNLTQDEFMRRYSDMNKLQQNVLEKKSMSENYGIVVNSNHPAIYKLNSLKGEKKSDKAKLMLQVFLVSNNLLKGKELNEFTSSSYAMIVE